MRSHKNGVNKIFDSPKVNQPDSENKVHNTSRTSLESFKIINKTGLRLKERKIVLDAINGSQPITSRRLSKLTGIERTNITRTLFDLVHDTPPRVKEAFIGKCNETGRKVKFYTLIEWEQKMLF